jgi:hypothetical protein
MDASQNTFIPYINEKYRIYKEEIMYENIGEDLCSLLSKKDQFKIFQYQEFLYQYMKDLNNQSNKDYKELKNRGLLIYHGLGTGKSVSGILLGESCRNYNLNPDDNHYKTKEEYQRKVILMIPANLFYDPWIKEISSRCFQNCEIRDAIKKIIKEKNTKKEKKEKIIKKLLEFDYHVIHYNAYNDYEKKILNIPTRKKTIDKYINKISNRDNPFDDSVVIIDESHNFTSMISNKIKTKKEEDVLVYEYIKNSKNSRIFLLSATPIVNNIFEMSIIANIIRGVNIGKEIKFEDNYEKFLDKFIDIENNQIKNPNMLRRRLNGIISYNKGINDEVFAKKIEENLYVPFNPRQEHGYKIAEKLKNMEKKGKKKEELFDTRTLFKRKASNVILPYYIFDKKELSKLKLTKNKKPINVEHISNDNYLLNETITMEYEKKIIKILDNDKKPLNINNDLKNISKKVYLIINKILQSNGPVLVYSSFVGLYGIKFIEEALKQNDFINYNGKNVAKNGTYMKWTGKERNQKYKNIFNLEENKDGKNIKVFLMTSSGKEGISLMSIRQVHILEPWWNNIVTKQVIGRGIRICSHHNIKKEDFIDFRYNKKLQIYNNRIVNVFKYFGFIDMRYIENKQSKRMKIQIMKNRSIDYQMKSISEKKTIMTNQLSNLLKEIAIDCNINEYRNNETHICYIDKNHTDFFNSWNIQDNEIQIIKKEYKKLIIKDILFFIDQFNNIYKLKNKIIHIDFEKLDDKIQKIGILKNNKINFDNEYYKKEIIHEIKNKVIEIPNIDTITSRHIKNIIKNNPTDTSKEILKKILKKYSGINRLRKKIIMQKIEKIIEKKLKKNKNKPKKLKKNKNKTKKLTKKLTKEECEKWEQHKKEAENNKIVSIRTGKKINYKKKNGDFTKIVKDINQECEK